MIRFCLFFQYSDRNPDCLDASDEGEHCKDRICDESMFQCPESGRCIPKVWLCDVDRDCVNGEDGKCSRFYTRFLSIFHPFGRKTDLLLSFV